MTRRELTIDDRAGSDLHVVREGSSGAVTLTVTNGYRGDRGESCGMDLTPHQVGELVMWLINTWIEAQDD